MQQKHPCGQIYVSRSILLSASMLLGGKHLSLDFQLADHLFTFCQYFFIKLFYFLPVCSWEPDFRLADHLFYKQFSCWDSSNGFHLIKKEALICWHIPLWEHLWAFRLDFGNHPKNPISELVIKYWNTLKFIFSTILNMIWGKARAHDPPWIRQCYHESSNILDQDVIFKVVWFKVIPNSKHSSNW